MSEFYVAKQQVLKEAINKTGTSGSAVASAGKLSRETLRKATQGGRLTSAKAYGIINGLNACGSTAVLDEIFERSD